jgi:hypothetical protein
MDTALPSDSRPATTTTHADPGASHASTANAASRGTAASVRLAAQRGADPT